VPWGRDAAHFAGHVYAMEAASLLPVAALVDAFEGGQPPQGVRVLDAAAAPGGKTAALAAWAAPVGGGVMANEPNANRSKALVDNLLRTGAMPWCAVTQLDARHCGKWWPEEFDAVLLDAPCSGESLTRRGWLFADRWDQADNYLNHLSNLQRLLAASAFRALKPGGVLVYSTCTLNPSENEGVASYLQETFGDAIEVMPLDRLPGTQGMGTPDGHLRCWPQVADTQGFFVARFRKVSSTGVQARVGGAAGGKGRKGKSKEYRDTSLGGRSVDPVNQQEAKAIERIFREAFGVWTAESEPGLVLRRRGKEIWLIPEVLAPLRGAGLRRSGIRLAEAKARNLPYPAHFEWAVSFAHKLPAEGGPGVATLSAQAARAFCAGEDVEPDWCEASALARDGAQAVARCGDHLLGIGRWRGAVLRNDTPRHWRCPDIAL